MSSSLDLIRSKSVSVSLLALLIRFCLDENIIKENVGSKRVGDLNNQEPTLML